MPAMNNILSKWIPVSERSRALSLVYSGMYLGSVTGLAVSPILIQQFKWPSVFYSFGSLGSIWFALWLSKVWSCFPQLFFIGNLQIYIFNVGSTQLKNNINLFRYRDLHEHNVMFSHAIYNRNTHLKKT